MRDTVVKEYASRRSMQRGVNRMAGRGYQVHDTAGTFSRNPFAFRWNRRRVVVTYRREQTPPPAPIKGGTAG